jgi:hypothetical protein
MEPYAGADSKPQLRPLQSRLQRIYHGQPYAKSIYGNPMPKSTLTPSLGLWIRPQTQQILIEIKTVLGMAYIFRHGLAETYQNRLRLSI